MTSPSLDAEKLDELYLSYGFKIRPSDNPLIKIYSLRSGPFHNAEIVLLSSKISADHERDAYTKAGFSCSIRKYRDIKEVERSLFEGFFDIKKTIENIKLEYKNYTQRVTASYNSDEYRYVNCSYLVDDSEATDSRSLIQNIYDELNTEIPKLFLIEAAASYGKTCSAFEIMNHIARNDPMKIPMLTELSRNRTARIFRYVLLDEINKSFPTLNYDLVKTHIHKKNVILIIDGFDELLHRNDKGKENFENVEPMLETIKELLHENAKIILTTRKTAIFSGDEFHIWVDEHSNDFDVIRYEINQPTAIDWLGYDRCSKLESCEFPVEQLSNPVLLSFLRSLSDKDFRKYCVEYEKIISVYVERLLEREIERQNLIMVTEEQLRIVKGIVSHFISEDVSTINKKELHQLIANDNIELLKEVRTRYSAENRPSIEELINKLSMHAFFDRKGSDEGLIGFVNDFLFGLFIAMNALDDETHEWLTNEYFVDIALTSYGVERTDKKAALWEKLEFMFEILPAELQIRVDLLLKGELLHKFSDMTFNQLRLKDIALPGKYIMHNSAFYDCQFTNVKFNKNQLDDISFFNCKFYSCKVISNDHEPNKIEFYNCHSDDETFVQRLQTDINRSDSREESIDYNRIVLERFWQQGRSHFKKKKPIRTLYTGIGKEQHRWVADAIEDLKKDGLIILSGDSASINLDRINELRDLLGR